MVPADYPADRTPIVAPQLDPGPAEWVRTLTGFGAEPEAALARLHELLPRIAPREAHRRSSQLRVTGPEPDDLAYQASSGVRAGSRAGHATSSSSKCQRKPAGIPGATPACRYTPRTGTGCLAYSGPPQEPERPELTGALRHATDNDLTQRQRQVLVAIALYGVPLDALARNPAPPAARSAR
jgi:RNA polymerase sigma-70 factor (ECF subfamily)